MAGFLDEWRKPSRLLQDVKTKSIERTLLPLIKQVRRRSLIPSSSSLVQEFSFHSAEKKCWSEKWKLKFHFVNEMMMGGSFSCCAILRRYPVFLYDVMFVRRLSKGPFLFSLCRLCGPFIISQSRFTSQMIAAEIWIKTRRFSARLFNLYIFYEIYPINFPHKGARALSRRRVECSIAFDDDKAKEEECFSFTFFVLCAKNNKKNNKIGRGFVAAALQFSAIKLLASRHPSFHTLLKGKTGIFERKTGRFKRKFDVLTGWSDERIDGKENIRVWKWKYLKLKWKFKQWSKIERKNDFVTFRQVLKKSQKFDSTL